MAAVDRFSLPFTQWLDGNGAPVAGGKLYFYLTGTTTLQTTYSDAALTVANANPVVADADGRFADIFLDPSKTYKVVLKTSADATVWTADPVRSREVTETYETYSDLRAATAPSDGLVVTLVGYNTANDGGGGNFVWDASSTATHDAGTIIQLAAGGDGRWLRLTQGNEFWVDWFGAVRYATLTSGTIAAATDSTAAIQAAITAVGANGVVRFSQGWYKTTSTLTVAQNAVTLRGAGRDNTFVVFAPTGDDICIDVTQGASSVTYGTYEGITLYSFDSTYYKIGIHLNDVRNYRITEFSVRGGIAVSGASYWSGGGARTFTAATSDVVTIPSGLYDVIETGDPCTVSSTTTLPAGLSAATTYYAIGQGTANTIKLATSEANALAGTAIDITDTGTGTHSITLAAGASVGVKANGRDFMWIDHGSLTCDKPMIIGLNPNNAISFDHSVVDCVDMIANQNPHITIADGANITDCTFSNLSFSKGGHGFLWRNTSATADITPTFAFIRQEQSEGSDRYFAKIVRTNGQIQAPIFMGIRCGGGSPESNFLYLRGAIINPTLVGGSYAGTGVGLNVDDAVIDLQNFGMWFNSTSTFVEDAAGDQVLLMGSPIESARAAPSFALYGSVNKVGRAFTLGAARRSKEITLADDATTIIGGNTTCGHLVVEDGTFVGTFRLRGTTAAAVVISDDSAAFDDADTDTKRCVFWDAGSSKYLLKNRTGGSLTFTWTFDGRMN